MSWGFDCAVTGGGRGLLLRRAGQSIAELVFGLPGEPVKGWELDESEARITATMSGRLISPVKCRRERSRSSSASMRRFQLSPSGSCAP